MSVRALARLLLVWVVATAVVCALVHRAFALHVRDAPIGVVVSAWSAGQLVGRWVMSREGARDAAIDASLASHPGATRVDEAVVAEGPVVSWSDTALALSFVPGRDGVSATYGDRTAFVTPDELLARQAYDHGVSFPWLQLSVGVDVPVLLALLSERLGAPARDVLERATLRRIRVVRTVAGPPPPPRTTARTMTDADLKAAAFDAAAYLARGVDAQGRFRYLVDAPTNKTFSGYDWPRHAGATYFLAQIARVSGDADVRFATLRAAGYLRDHAMVACGANRCIGDAPVVDVGSTALAVVAFIEVLGADLDASYALLVPELTAFLRSQQRPDGEFMHEYDRDAGHPIDVQLLYYSGEAALALSRAHARFGDPRDLVAASRAVARLTGPGWAFFGSRYYWGEEHWTCQAVDDLWDRAPDRAALDFCLGWQAFSRKLQYGPGDTAYDADGAYGFGPILTPRLTPAGSRTEAAIATLRAARRAGVGEAELGELEQQARRGLALLLRHQFRPGPTHLFDDPAAVEGAMPGSEVDWQLRIDYAQHAGCAMVRWLELGLPDAPEPALQAH